VDIVPCANLTSPNLCLLWLMSRFAKIRTFILVVACVLHHLRESHYGSYRCSSNDTSNVAEYRSATASCEGKLTR
jgi:hypothetical protein